MIDIREKLMQLVAICPCESSCEGLPGSCPNRKNSFCNNFYKLPYCAFGKLVDHLIANGVTVQRERELVCVTKTGPSEAVYFRKIYFCPSCNTKIGHELLDVNTERVFGHGTVMKDNKFPKCCPECGTRIVMPTPPKGE